MTTRQTGDGAVADVPAPPVVKCVVWDLDGTVWHGTMIEDSEVELRDGVADLIRELDSRGVLHSIASKNDPDHVTAKLESLGLADYFLTPQVGWDAKSLYLRRIAEQLNIGTDTLLFVDDSPFERAEVKHELPEVRCLDPAGLDGLLARADLPPVRATADAGARRERYRDQSRRVEYEATFTGPREAFLRSLEMRLTVRPARPADLDRAVELTQRTNQLNTTGVTFSRAQLDQLMGRAEHTVLVASLTDRFGSYGTIGLVLLTEQDGDWRIRLFLMSCRVMGRNVGGAVLSHLAREADSRGLALSADFRHTSVNRQMYMVYRLAGFAAGSRSGDTEVLRLSPTAARITPAHLDLQTL